jgi:hypothetical protein
LLLLAAVSCLIFAPTPMKADTWTITTTGTAEFNGTFMYNDATLVDSAWTGPGTGFVDQGSGIFKVNESDGQYTFTAEDINLISFLPSHPGLSFSIVEDGPDGFSAGSWTAVDNSAQVPEPTTFALLLTALLAVSFFLCAKAVRRRLRSVHAD